MSESGEKPRQRGLTPEITAAARKAYEGGEPLATIARRMKLNRTTLIKARDRSAVTGDPWIIQPTVQVSPQDVTAIKERATNKVIDMATRKVVHQAEESGLIDALAMTVNDILLAQSRVAAKAQLLAEETLDKIRLGVQSQPLIMPGEKSDWGQLVGGGIVSAERSISMGREIAGLKAGQPSEPRDAKKALNRRFVVKVPDEIKQPEEVKEAS